MQTLVSTKNGGCSHRRPQGMQLNSTHSTAAISAQLTPLPPLASVPPLRSVRGLRATPPERSDTP
eukprot:3282483-Pleurochrysis_carterae.AAC.1